MYKYFLLCFLFFTTTVNRVVGQETIQAPNILFFLIDDIRNTSLGCYDHPIIQTPNIDEIANKGTKFTNAFVTTSICAASRASILTGLYESTHNYTFGKPPISQQQTDESYPIQLKKVGYQTGFIGKWGMKTAVPKEQLYDFIKPINRDPYFIKTETGELRHETELCGDEAIQFINQQKKNTPFCLQISFNAAHAEDGDKENHFPNPKAVDGLYADLTLPEPRLNDPAVYEAMPDFLKKSLNRDRYFWRWDTPEKYQKNIQSYFRMISGIDKVVGRIWMHLKEKGMDENTIIIITGDNGYYMGDRGFAGKWSHFEESLRVPLVIYDPRQTITQNREELALNIDIPATILGYASITPPAHYQGESLVPILQKQPIQQWRTSFFAEHRMQHKAIPKWEGIRDKRYVYANYYEQQPAYEFLHDLEKDPDQLINLVNDRKYRRILRKMRKQVKKKERKYF